MQRSDTNHPDFFHQVVNCQWACPAHTDIPEYIRLIAHGKYTEAYLVNRESNVFPGILGRVCDRPCEPVCRRGRVESEPVAICRLKRVAADLKGTFELPQKGKPNGKRVALIGGGPASLVVANDLLPLGYELVIFEKWGKLGGLMRTNIPAFRLPEEVLDEEIDYIVKRGVEVRLNTEISSLKKLLAEGFDACFVGTGAPRGKDLKLPGQNETTAVSLGMEWLESVAFEHVHSVLGPRVLVIGAGNTAMDCARTSFRLGAKEVSVVARRPAAYFKASPWELEEAKEEGVQFLENLSPQRFIVSQGKLTGMEFSELEWTEKGGELISRELGSRVISCDQVILAVGQERAFPFIEKDIGIEFDQRGFPKVDRVTLQSTRPGVFFGGDAAFGPQNIIWAVAHGHAAALSIDLHCRGVSPSQRPSDQMELQSRQMGFHEWSFDNDYSIEKRKKTTHVELGKRMKSAELEADLGFDLPTALKEAHRCLNCDIQTVFFDSECIECDACVDVCPMQCLTITENAEEGPLREKLMVPARNLEEKLFVSDALVGTGKVMVKDENVCVHCSLCAERCPTGAWDMQKFLLKIPYAGTR